MKFKTDCFRIIDPSVVEDGTPSKLRDEIQWPALDKLTPGNLKRTVSTLMKEWERNLTPPPEENENTSTKPADSDNTTESSDRELAVSQMHHF